MQILYHRVTRSANPHLVTTARLLNATIQAWTVLRIRLTEAFLDALNKAKGNQMNTLDELRVVLDDTAQDMAQAVPDPSEWSKFIIYFLEELEDKAEVRVAHPRRSRRVS